MNSNHVSVGSIPARVEISFSQKGVHVSRGSRTHVDDSGLLRIYK